jgi:hypothetical protein
LRGGVDHSLPGVIVVLHGISSARDNHPLVLMISQVKFGTCSSARPRSSLDGGTGASYRFISEQAPVIRGFVPQRPSVLLLGVKDAA